MFCTKCGNKIADHASFCSVCGARQPMTGDMEELSILVNKAKSGEQQAFAELYKKTYDKVFYTVKSMIKDEDAVLDIVQDTYMKAFRHLDRFNSNASFLTWIRTIAANTGRDWIRKKKPVLFSDINSDTNEEYDFVDQIEDDRAYTIPEDIIDRKETVRLIREILMALPDDQRMVIGLYYYQEMSVKEIAALLDISESAVKSRLMYGRKKIEARVLELEKKGTRLYSFSPLPFFALLVALLKKNGADVQPDKVILEKVLRTALPAFEGKQMPGFEIAEKNAKPAAGDKAHGSGKTEVAGKTVAGREAGVAGKTVATGKVAAAGKIATAGKAASGLGIGKITLIAAASTVVIAGSALGIKQIAFNHKDAKTAELSSSEAVESNEPVADGSADGSSDGSTIDAIHPDEKKLILEVDTEETGSEETASEETESEEAEIIEVTPEMLAWQEYIEIIENVESINFMDDQTDKPTGEYRYALVKIEPDDQVPALLVSATMGYAYSHHIRVFQYDAEQGIIIAPEDMLSERNFLVDQMDDGNGLKFVERINADELSLSRIVIRDAAWVSIESTGVRIGEEADPSFCSHEIEWYDISDHSQLNLLAGVTNSEQAGNAEGEGNAEEAGISSYNEDDLPEDGSRLVLVGTLMEYTHDQLVERQGRPDPNAAYAYLIDSYRVIEFDEPIMLECRRGADPGYKEGEAWCISVNYADGLDQYIGKRIVFSIDTSMTYWPSDTGLPLGQPATSDIHVLK